MNIAKFANEIRAIERSNLTFGSIGEMGGSYTIEKYHFA